MPAGWIGYLLSLPERTVRALVGSVSGVSKVLTDSLLPGVVRETHFYRVFLGNMQRFLIEDIGRVEGAFDAEDGEALPEDYLPRKIAGNAVEAAGLFTVHLSPLWIFAAIGDLGKGSAVFLNRLRTELRNAGVEVSEDSSLEDMLHAVHDAGRQSATLFDAPPISNDAFQKFKQETSASFRNLGSRTGAMLPRMDKLQEQMNRLIKEGHSPAGLAGIMAVKAAGAVNSAANTSVASAKSAWGLFDENVLDAYASALSSVRERGYSVVLKETAEPYVKMLSSAWNPQQDTVTQSLVGKLLGRLKKQSE